MAVFVDAEGKVASAAAAGTLAVLKLARAKLIGGDLLVLGGTKERRERIAARSRNSS